MNAMKAIRTSLAIVLTANFILFNPTGLKKVKAYTLPNFELPYYALTGPEWSGGPHQWGNGVNEVWADQGKDSGLDFAQGSTNFPVAAMADGYVIYAGASDPDNGIGTQVAVENDGGTVLIYGHLDHIWQPILDALANEEPYRILAGYTIGYAGNTGYGAHGVTHLHVELRDGSDTCCSTVHIGGEPISWNGLVLQRKVMSEKLKLSEFFLAVRTISDEVTLLVIAHSL